MLLNPNRVGVVYFVSIQNLLCYLCSYPVRVFKFYHANIALSGTVPEGQNIGS